MKSGPTLPERILLAVADAEPLTPADLVVVAWRAFPAWFSLTGYDYPDSNLVLSKLMGQRGLPQRGYLDYDKGTKTYRITPKGVGLVQRLRGNENGTVATPEKAKDVKPQVERIRLITAEDSMLRHLFAAAMGIDEDRPTYARVSAFWSVGDGDANEAIAQTGAFLRSIFDALTGETVLSNGRAVGRPDVAELIGLHERLQADPKIRRAIQLETLKRREKSC